jgi:glycosyltransferase involved in cell wall biosynthesis
VEHGTREAHGMTICGVDGSGFKTALEKLQPDVVRAYGGFWPADLACRNRLRGVPVVVSVHDTNPDLLHRSVRYADVVISVSEAVRKLLLGAGVERDRIRLLPNRVDMAIFKPMGGDPGIRELDARFPAGRRILHVGRKCEQKNLDTLIRAISELPNVYHAIFVGLGDKEPYEALAHELGVEQQCHWVPAVRNTELPLWYSWCDCMCTPSRWEGFGIVFIEAAACGAAIVTSDLAPMNEYLRDGENATLVKDHESPQALAGAIRKTCEDREYRARISAGAVHAACPFERTRIDQKEAKIYMEAATLPPLSMSRALELRLWRIFGG